jgi:hypothetical protein
VIAGLDCTLFADVADFTWEGADEMDPVSGDGWDELDDSKLVRSVIADEPLPSALGALGHDARIGFCNFTN